MFCVPCLGSARRRSPRLREQEQKEKNPNDDKQYEGVSRAELIEMDQRNQTLLSLANQSAQGHVETSHGKLQTGLQQAKDNYEKELERIKSNYEEQLELEKSKHKSALTSYQQHLTNALPEKSRKAMHAHRDLVRERAANAVTELQRSQFFDSVKEQPAFRDAYRWGAESTRRHPQRSQSSRVADGTQKTFSENTYNGVHHGSAFLSGGHFSGNSGGWHINVPTNSNGNGA